VSEASSIPDQQFRLRKQRIAIAARALLSSLMVAQVLFASFAVGAHFGPVPLRPLELLLGSSMAILFALVVAPAVIRRRLEDGATLTASLREGRKTTRVVLFDDYLVLGPEIVLKASITSAEIDGSVLVLRYRDPRFEGVVLRELSGETPLLERIAASVDRPTPS
jgi:hypothetical protein